MPSCVFRIIPARAGFTGRDSVYAHDLPDHPRSRGVYRESTEVMACRLGSSPLARGLLDPSAVREAQDGIIPARAGFTSRLRATSSTSRDHPRSRGVYIRSQAERSRSRGSSPLARGLRCCVPACAGGAGSSPLARGLPGASVTVTGVRGIIPARAGFTGGAPFVVSEGRDHPRSRGVYFSQALATFL